MYISTILYPIWEYTHNGFPPHRTPPHAGAVRRGAGEGMGWGGGGIIYGYISILDVGYWIFIYTDITCILEQTKHKNKKLSMFVVNVFESHRRSESNANNKVG